MSRPFILAATATALVCAAMMLYLLVRDASPRAAGTPPAQEPPRQAEAPAPPVIETAGEWNTYHGDHLLRGVAEAKIPEAPEVLWRLKTGAPVRQTPVVHDGRLFAVTARGEVIAADLDGKELWRRELFRPDTADGKPARLGLEAPPLAFDGMVVLGSDEGVLLALDAATGEERWRRTLDGTVRGAPNWLPGVNRLFVLEQSAGVLYCLDAATGAEQWRAPGVERSDSTPSVSEKAIVFGSCAGALHVRSPENGESLFDIKIEGDGQVAGGVALDGVLAYAGARGGMMIAADTETGAILWTNEEARMEVFSTAAVNGDWVVFASHDGVVYALDRATGKTRWTHDTGGMPLSPVIVGDKVAVSADGTLFLLRLEDGAMIWSLELGDEITGPAVTRRGLYVGGEDGTIVALGDASMAGTAMPRGTGVPSVETAAVLPVNMPRGTGVPPVNDLEAAHGQ
ncbi:MAG: PQQ-binding-like beta-propeller repeat protein [Candidatus Hydrogenedens sp.]|nr:PQQ-binding-like beta-propeller repeat protein [Candidatus Hydrogenedentota bacterium]NLF57396.1 PQQ-binding-like beta-propeller repeat protein [Candidatus Hydrogenedens sp.]